MARQSGRPAGRAQVWLRTLVGFAVIAGALLGGIRLGGAAAADFHGSVATDGTAASASLGGGDSAYFTFSASSGDRVFVNVTTSGGVYQADLLNPSSTSIASTGWFVSGNPGFIDTTSLSSTGTYTVKVSPVVGSGTVTAKVWSVPADASNTITAGGSAVALTMSTPGQNGTLTFSGTSGDRVFVKTVASSMSGSVTNLIAVNLLKPDGSSLGSANTVASGPSYIDTTTLPTTGTYTIKLDPFDDTTGTGTVTVLGPS